MSEGGARPPSSRDVAGEDFLFHLYRGSELLQDDRVHDAKAELEQALSLQPSDPKGQDLLGIVYFRLGLYPRAITIYERLIQMHPDAIEPRINLALSYLKTGQAASARTELEKVVEQNPGHGRAWGYLGLAFQRLGDYERASHAFAAGGHDTMAKRLLEMTEPKGPPSLRPEPPHAPKEVRVAADEAFHEIDRVDAFRPASDQRRMPSGTWSAVELGRERLVPVPLPDTRGLGGEGVHPHIAVANGPVLAIPPPSPSSPPSADVASAPRAPKGEGPRAPADLARTMLVVFPRDMPVATHPSGLVLVQAGNGFATRLDALRSLSHGATYTHAILPRKARGKNLDEPLGGADSPIVEIRGRGDLMLGPTAGHRLAPIVLTDEAFYLREEALVAFDLTVLYENGRLAVGDGDALGMVQLRGPGTVVASLPEKMASIEVTEGRSTALRGGSVLGWVGRVVPRTLLPSESPAGVRGLVSFVGEGMVLVDAR